MTERENIDSKELVDMRVMAEKYMSKGARAYEKSEDDRAIELYNKSLNIYEKLKDKRAMANTYSNMASVYGYNEESMKFHNKSFQLYKEDNYKLGMAAAYRQMGEVSKNLKDYQKALSYYQKSLTLFKEVKDEGKQAEWFDCYIDASSTIFHTSSKEDIRNSAGISGFSEKDGYYRLDRRIIDRYSKESCGIIVTVVRIIEHLFESDRTKDKAVNMLMEAGFERDIGNDIVNIWNSSVQNMKLNVFEMEISSCE